MPCQAQSMSEEPVRRYCCVNRNWNRDMELSAKVSQLARVMFVPLIFGCISMALASEVRVDSYVKSATEGDDTAAFQAAIDSGADVVIVPDIGRSWIVKPVFGRSNLTLHFEKGVVVEAKKGEYKPRKASMFNVECCTNVTVSGYGARLRMRKWEYHTKDYVRSEFRHALRFMSCKNVLVEGLYVLESGGDGIVFGVDYDKDPEQVNMNVTVRNVVCDGNNRQGISIISAENLLIENSDFINTYGTAPSAGIDLEPNMEGDRLVNCQVRNCRFKNNAGSGIEVYTVKLTAKSRPVSILIEECQTYGNLEEVLFRDSAKRYWHPKSMATGKVLIRNCTFRNPRTEFIKIPHELGRGVKIEFDGCKFIDDPFLTRYGIKTPQNVLNDMPGLMKKVPKVKMVNQAYYAVSVDRPRKVRIRASLDGVKPEKRNRWKHMLHPPAAERFDVLNSEKVKVGEFMLPEKAGDVEWQIDLPVAGVYTFGGYAHRVMFIKESDVPIAIDVTGQGCYMLQPEVTLYAYVPSGSERLDVCANGMGQVDRMNILIRDPSGLIRGGNPASQVSERYSYEKPMSGVWQFEIGKPIQGKHSGCGIDMHGAPGDLFLDINRMWR